MRDSQAVLLYEGLRFVAAYKVHVPDIVDKSIKIEFKKFDKSSPYQDTQRLFSTPLVGSIWDQ